MENKDLDRQVNQFLQLLEILEKHVEDLDAQQRAKLRMSFMELLARNSAAQWGDKYNNFLEKVGLSGDQAHWSLETT